MFVIPPFVQPCLGWRSPVVMVIQATLNLDPSARQIDVDGIFGQKTLARLHEIGCTGTEVTRECNEKLAKWRNKILSDNHDLMSNVSLPVKYVIASIVSAVEVGYRKHAFDHIEGDIGDGAGTNYGAFCFNSRGSMAEFMTRFPGMNREEALRTPLSGPVQVDMIWNKVTVDDVLGTVIYDSPVYTSKTMVLALLTTFDVIVQNGSWSHVARPPKCIDEEWWDEHVWWYDWGRVKKHGKNMSALFLDIADNAWDLNIDPQQVLVAFATLRAWASRPKYARAVWRRKLAMANGFGRIHGIDIDVVNHWGLASWLGSAKKVGKQ